MNRRTMELDFSALTLYPAKTRHNLVTTENIMTPGVNETKEFCAVGFDTLVKKNVTARKNGREVIVSIGAHVIKCGLSRYLIALAKDGWITHLSANGACSIHDFELAMLGGTSEDVPTAIEDGSFGMWDETLTHMNRALNEGAAKGWGYGEALAEYVEAHPDLFPTARTVFSGTCISSIFRLHTTSLSARTSFISHPTVTWRISENAPA